MKMNNLSFKGGTHIKDYKDLSAEKATERMEDPKIVHIPLDQHIGSVCEPLVQVNDVVKIGQKIGSSSASLSSDVHSSVSGVVTAIEEMYTTDGSLSKCITIETDGLNEVDESIKPIENFKSLSFEEKCDLIKGAGIIGMGGAGFPLHSKLQSAVGANIDSVILNGAECEPYLNSDYRVMLEKTVNIVEGLQIIKEMLNAEAGYIAIEDNKPKAIDAFNEIADNYNNVTVASLVTKFPQGDSTRIVNAVTGRRIPSGGRTSNVQCTVTNVGTVNALYELVSEGKPVYERIVSVTGQGVKEPKNLMVKVGTSVKDVIEYCGGFNDNANKVLSGGPMTGNTIFDLDAPITKSTTGIVVLTEDLEDTRLESPCIKCSRCIDVCPQFLMPNIINAAVNKEKYDLADEHGANDCIECGSCSYICPAKRKLTESIALARKEIKLRKK
ncbi:MAG: electron transport complex subunit RsxC [Tissierellia bacterium]|nr:electron transport complex subunit RsxC [Tissierellia bacterium]